MNRLSDLLLDLSGLAHAVTQVVQLGTTNLTLADGLDHSHIGRMQGEHLLTAYAVGNPANSDGLADAAMLAGNDSAFKHLNALTLALANLNMNLYGRTDFDFRCVFLQHAGSELLNIIL